MEGDFSPNWRHYSAFIFLKIWFYIRAMMTNTDYDGAWKELLELYFQDFMQLCFPLIACKIDWNRPYVFMDKELQAIVRDADIGKLRVDKLIKIFSLDGGEEWLLVHIEIQSQPDCQFPWRIYVYRRRLQDCHDRPVLSLAVLADTQADWRPNRYEEDVWGCRLILEFPIVKLMDIPQKVLDESDNPVAVIIAAHRAAQQSVGDVPVRFDLKWRLTRRLYERGFSKKDVMELFRLIDWLLMLPEAEAVAFRSKLVEYEEEKVMPYVTSIERIGRQKGRQEGQLKLIERLLLRRFGALPETMTTRLKTLESAQLEELADALLDFKSPADLEAWLYRQV